MKLTNDILRFGRNFKLKQSYKLHMKRVVSLFVLLTAISHAWAQNRAQVVLDNYKDSLRSYGIIALIDDGKDKKIGTVGFSHDGVSIQPEHTFCIGSCSKMYTAVAVLLLQEQGKLSITDSLYRYIPPNPFVDSTITIHHLLNHTSGITDYTNYGIVNEALYYPFKDYSDTYILTLLDTVDFQKGARYKYSNTNYFLLRMIIERAADKPYEAVVDELIIDPLHLKNTYTYYSSEMSHLAHPSWRGQDVNELSKLGTNMISRGDGNLVSDASDLNTFIRALLLDSMLLNSESLRIMTSFTGEKKSRNGCGLFADSIGVNVFWGHTGRQFSYISYAYVNPETGESFVLLTNNANDTYIDEISKRIGRLD